MSQEAETHSTAAWAYHSDIGADEYHVWPLDDLIEHELDGDGCVCGPTVEPIKRESGSVTWMITHHSLDGREHVERASRAAAQDDGEATA